MNEFIVNLKSAVDGFSDADLRPETEFQKLPGWDSLALLCIIGMADESYGVSLRGKEIIQCASVESLFNLIQSKK